MAVLTQRFDSLGLSTPGDAGTGGGSGSSAGTSSVTSSAGRGLRLSRLLPRSGKPVGVHKVTNYSAQVGAGIPLRGVWRVLQKTPRFVGRHSDSAKA